jgi:hypothetical protein
MEIGFALCAIESRVWTGAITDSVTSAEVTSNKKAANDAGKFIKVLVRSSALASVRNAVNKARAALYGASVPWLASSHLVKIERMGELNALIEEQRKVFNDGVARFISEYPKLVEGAAERLGALFDASDYPSQEALAAKFSFSVTWLPFTKAPHDVLSAMDAEAARMIEGSVNEAIERGRKEAHAEIIARTIESVEGVKTCLDRYSAAEKNGERAVLHDSRIDSLKNAARDLLDYSFPADDAKADSIEKLTEELLEVAAEGADTFKENAAARAAADKALSDIKQRLESMRAWC